MTKTLTEQWKDIDLADEHLYYWRMPNGEVRSMSKMGVYSYKLCYDGGGIDNLAPVPSYDEWQAELESNNELLNVQKRLENKIKLLEEQLNYALETMGQVAKLSDNMVDSVQCAHAICLINERLKEVEGLK